MIPIEVVDLCFRYRSGAGLTGVSFRMEPGAFLGVVGPNSAGKSTLLKLLSKVLVPAEGRIRYGERDLATFSRLALARQVAVVPQELQVAFPFTVAEVILMGRFPHAPSGLWSRKDRAVAAAMLDRLELAGLGGRRLDELSGGERQLVSIARALTQEPAVLLLDEPTAHLDLRHQRLMLEILLRERAAGRTLILVSHDLNLAAEQCDRLLLLTGGAVQALGTPEEVMTAFHLEQAYGCAVEVERSPASGRPRLVSSLRPE